jgi:hypothetical protein
VRHPADGSLLAGAKFARAVGANTREIQDEKFVIPA